MRRDRAAPRLVAEHGPRGGAGLVVLDPTMAIKYAAGLALLAALIASLGRDRETRARIGRLQRELGAARERARNQAERADARARELTTLLATSRSVASTLEMEPLMGLILDQFKVVVDYAAASVRLIDGADLVLLAYRGLEREAHFARGRTRLEQSPAVREMVRRRAPLIIGDFRVDEPALLDDFRREHASDLAPLWGQLRAWMAVPLIVRDEVLGAIVISHGTPRYYTPRHAELALALASHAAAAVKNARLYERSQQAAARRERQRLARELHDAVTQTLFSASLIAEVLPRMWERDPRAARERLEELRQLTRGALAEMRALLLELRPAALTEAPLPELLRLLCEAASGRARMPVALETDGEAVALPAEVQVALYRITQEALHNMTKHAGARRAKVRLDIRPNAVDLHVEDDGAGFDPDAGPAGRMGLRIMRERAAAVGAHLLIESAPGKGARISVAWRGAAESRAPAGGAGGSHERDGAAVEAVPVGAAGKTHD
ncbi:MAG TPA: GAF domain-containing sensor histidine kinase [Chloroflexota bacterium]|nr:GAF domain-containing sensor histidine kinase [Chloroflexota bacterium]